MDDAVGALSRGSRVWYRHDAATWLLAEIRDAASGAIAITLLSGPQAGAELEGLQESGGVLVPANPALQQGIEDLTQLSYLNEPSILDNLTQRYEGDQIYTNAGPVLIAVNPCKALPLYTPQVACEYKGGCCECGWWVAGRQGPAAAALADSPHPRRPDTPPALTHHPHHTHTPTENSRRVRGGQPAGAPHLPRRWRRVSRYGAAGKQPEPRHQRGERGGQDRDD
jgi:hypothetical protein